MHGSRSLDQGRVAHFRLGLEPLELRNLPSLLGSVELSPPTKASAAAPSQSDTDAETNKADGQTGDTDGDAATYHSSDPSSSTGKTGYSDPKTKRSNLANSPTDKSSGSNVIALNYTKVSPVGYEHGQPIGSYDRVEILTPYSPAPVIGPDATSDVALPDANARMDGRTRSDIISQVLSLLGPIIAVGITTPEEPDHRMSAESDSHSESPVPGSNVSTTPTSAQTEEPSFRLPPLIAGIVPGEWTAAAEDVLHALDALGVVPVSPSTAWSWLYLWGTATAATALGTELARRYRSTVRARNWEEPE